MKITQIFVAIAAFSAFSISPAAYAADSVATVNGKPIKQTWVDYIMKDAQTRGQKPSDAMKNAIINELVGSELQNQRRTDATQITSEYFLGRLYEEEPRDRSRHQSGLRTIQKRVGRQRI